ncbi:MAG: dehypoxanthine futalosine cyclase [Saprospiraceae bacterium]|jgi:cyclic dehypoxanthinyl futalosine synthase|nr:dehypoxanthine futalosine cyclase [Saprospiraceae bacterium]MBK7370175.1 dehypoxanthine futalosine cyclase [Saprospiraceae bacterium]MBK8280883.1 dehypoxanthine futalosine cyclase [Saprospiraceae bacterium]MBP8941363.1 dehypoxanthine futalosine cyclase [Saprospiraceae bacterium]
MNTQLLLTKALQSEWLSIEEGTYLFKHATLGELMAAGHALRQAKNPGQTVTWIIDRNSNTTNVCVANCKFCNFYRVPGHSDAYITSLDQYKEKIEELFRYGGEQLLLQGGHHPDLGLDYYTKLFRQLKAMYPTLKLHALGPPEIAHISKISGTSHEETLRSLIESGLDSLPGAGAEILVDRVRNLIARGKCLSDEWLDVMREAHKLGLTTSATMMFGTIETIEERMEHLCKLRQVQHERPADAVGFLAFIPWPFQDEGTLLQRIKRAENETTAEEYVRMIALSRIMLPNIQNIQASWLTVGKHIAQICLHAGANDMGSIMIEENVVSAAGAPYRFTASGIQQAIIEAGYIPQLRDQQYQHRDLPPTIEQQQNIPAKMTID